MDKEYRRSKKIRMRKYKRNPLGRISINYARVRDNIQNSVRQNFGIKIKKTEVDDLIVKEVFENYDELEIKPKKRKRR